MRPKSGNLSRLIVVFVLFLAVISFSFSKYHPDSPTWVDAAAAVAQGKLSGTPEELRRLSMPVVPVLAAVLGKLVAIPTAFGIVNSIFVLATALLLFRYGYALGLKKSEGFYSSILFLSSLPILVYGGTVLVDPAVFFFMLVFLLLFLNFQKTPSKMKLVLLLIVGGLGILTKLNFIIAPFSMLAFSLFKRDFDPKKIFICIFPAIVFLAWLAFLGLPVSYVYGSAGEWATTYKFVDPLSRAIVIIKTFFTAFFFLPLLAPFGWKNEMDWSQFFLLVGALSVVVWPVPTGRYTFLLFPAVFKLACRGMKKIEKTTGLGPWFWLPAYLVFNFANVVFGLWGA